MKHLAGNLPQISQLCISLRHESLSDARGNRLRYFGRQWIAAP